MVKQGLLGMLRVNPPVRVVQACSSGCWPWPWWVRSPLEPLTRLSPWSDDAHEHTRHSHHSADAALPCGLNTHAHIEYNFRQEDCTCYYNIRSGKSVLVRHSIIVVLQHIFTSDLCGFIWATNLCELALSHWLFVFCTLPGLENCKLQPWPPWQAEHELLWLLHSSPADMMDLWLDVVLQNVHQTTRQNMRYIPTMAAPFPLCMTLFIDFIN